MQTTSIPLDRLVPNRKNRHIGDVSELRDSMATPGIGQLHPILVVDMGDGFYRIIAGHRRVAAAKLLRWESIGARIIDPSKADLAGAAENMLRLDLALSEKAELALEMLARNKPPDVAKSFGWTVAHTQRIAYLKRDLCPEAWELMQNQGHKAKYNDWAPFLTLDHDTQRKRLATNQKVSEGAKRLKRRQQLDWKILGLRPNDVRAKVLKWVMGEGEWPDNA